MKRKTVGLLFALVPMVVSALGILGAYKHYGVAGVATNALALICLVIGVWLLYKN